MIENPVRRKLLAGGTSLGVMAMEFFTPGLARVLAAGGAEFVILDTEHSGAGLDTIKASIAFARAAGIVPLVRVPGGARHLVCPVLDAGAMGIMLPMLETVEQARDLVSWCRYRPQGTRGLAFGIAHDEYRTGPVKQAMQAANEAILTIALIETEQGLRNGSEIMAVPGIDLGWLGHFDMTDSLGIVGQFDHPRFRQAEAELLAAAKAAGKPFGWLAGNGAEARAALARGFSCLCISTDVGLMRGAVEAEFNAARKGMP
jgi:2-keto-3-deoxy-L-rhamnonate aldolase RhmA